MMIACNGGVIVGKSVLDVGRGTFGVVRRGFWTPKGGEVAVKFFAAPATEVVREFTFLKAFTDRYCRALNLSLGFAPAMGSVQPIQIRLGKEHVLCSSSVLTMPLAVCNLNDTTRPTSASHVVYDTWDVVVDITRALRALSAEQIVHNDITAKNFLVFLINNKYSAVLGDFGAARSFKAMDTAFVRPRTTLEYESPETISKLHRLKCAAGKKACFWVAKAKRQCARNGKPARDRATYICSDAWSAYVVCAQVLVGRTRFVCDLRLELERGLATGFATPLSAWVQKVCEKNGVSASAARWIDAALQVRPQKRMTWMEAKRLAKECQAEAQRGRSARQPTPRNPK